MSFINEKGLKKLDEYKYVSGGYSWLDNKMNPFWVWFVDALMPSWLAPNMMTTIGFLFMASAYVIMLVYDFSLLHDVPSWTYFYAASCIFIYQTFDACDGKQARKTKSSSPLGQLYDHGCDSFAINFMFLSVIQAVNIPRDYIIFCYLNMQLMFWTSQWYENHTKILKTNVGNIGVTEAEFLIIALHLLTGVFGREFWGATIRKVSPGFLMNYLPLNMLDQPIYIYVYWLVNVALFVATLAMLLSVLFNKPNKLYQIAQFFPITLVIFLEIVAYKIPVLNQNYLGLVLISYGILFSLFCSKMIICSMTEMRFPLLHKEIIIPIICSIYLYFNKDNLESKTIIIIFSLNIASIVIATISFLHDVITEITRHLRIFCYTLRKREKNE